MRHNTKKTKSPHARFASDPFIGGFVDIEKETTDIVIGKSSAFDDLFFESLRVPEYIKFLAKIVPKRDFGRPKISAGYRVYESDEDDKTMTFDIYDGKAANMANFASELEIEFSDAIPGLESAKSGLKDEWQLHLSENRKIYTKTFHTQTEDKELDNFYDDTLQETDIIHTKTKAHYFAGYCAKGAKLSDIQQHLFCMGTSHRAQEYISVISGRDFVNSRQIEADSSVTLESIATLEDDITEGKIVLNLPASQALPTFGDQPRFVTYKSIFAKKTTVLSDIFQISFKREE